MHMRNCKLLTTIVLVPMIIISRTFNYHVDAFTTTLSSTSASMPIITSIVSTSSNNEITKATNGMHIICIKFMYMHTFGMYVHYLHMYMQPYSILRRLIRN